MYKIFFNDTPILIEEPISNLKQQKIESLTDLKPLIFRFLNNEKRRELRLCNSCPEIILNWLKELMIYIEAAGGLVENEDEEVLFIHRLGVWDLPKGKIEKGEDTKTAAYREIKEECGIQSHICQHHLADTYHIYELKGEWILKKTFWFYFKVEVNDETLRPQKEEDIEQVAWLDSMEIELALLDSYPSIIKVYEEYKNCI